MKTILLKKAVLDIEREERAREEERKRKLEEIPSEMQELEFITEEHTFGEVLDYFNMSQTFFRKETGFSKSAIKNLGNVPIYKRPDVIAIFVFYQEMGFLPLVRGKEESGWYQRLFSPEKASKIRKPVMYYRVRRRTVSESVD